MTLLDKNNSRIVVINKNRGWRGLAKLEIRTEHNNTIFQMIFSFSSDMWKDLLNGYIVVQDYKYYYIIKFDHITDLPKPTQQRSVLIKNFVANIVLITKYNKSSWEHDTILEHYNLIKHYIKNSNAHTKSDWNHVGMRVTPMI